MIWIKCFESTAFTVKVTLFCIASDLNIPLRLSSLFLHHFLELRLRLRLRLRVERKRNYRKFGYAHVHICSISTRSVGVLAVSIPEVFQSRDFLS
jgi:hypothetical protein